MRNQSIELLRIAKDLREHISSLNMPMDVNDEGHTIGVNIRVSDNGRMHYNTDYNYASIEFGHWPNSVTITLFDDGEFTNNTITINVEKTDDAQLDALILLVQSDIAIFKGLKSIKSNDVYTSAPSI